MAANIPPSGFTSVVAAAVFASDGTIYKSINIESISVSGKDAIITLTNRVHVDTLCAGLSAIKFASPEAFTVSNIGDAPANGYQVKTFTLAFTGNYAPHVTYFSVHEPGF